MRSTETIMTSQSLFTQAAKTKCQSFATFTAYKKAKEEYIKEVAQEYYNSGKIDKKVYEALLRYQIEITD